MPDSGNGLNRREGFVSVATSWLGKLLVACAVDRCLQALRQVAAFALIVDAKNLAAKEFYQHYGFVPSVDSPMTLYLPLGAVG